MSFYHITLICHIKNLKFGKSTEKILNIKSNHGITNHVSYLFPQVASNHMNMNGVYYFIVCSPLM